MPRTNDAVAKMLEEFGELLAISGGDQFKVRAYEKAARAVAGHPADIAGLDEKGLDFIPNITTGSGTPAEADADTFSAVMIAHTRPGLVGLSWWWEPRRALS